MSSIDHHSVPLSFLQEGRLVDQRWENDVVPTFPAEMEEQAWMHGAMQRKSGKLIQPGDLLRGILMYTLCAPSLRFLGPWGVLVGIADLSNTSWRRRIRQAGPWLSWLVGALLVPQACKPQGWLSKAGYGPVQLVDATHVSCVGPRGKVWRIHCMYDLLSQQISQVFVSSNKVAENLKHFELKAGVIYVHDSGYGYRDRIAQSLDAEAYTVSAFHPSSMPLLDEKEEEINLVSWLKEKRAKSGAVHRMTAWFEWEGKKRAVRVIALRKTKEQTLKAQKKKQSKAKRNHYSIKADTIYLAGWLLVLTTLPEKDWTAKEVLKVYRARWQIELLFKRIKQILDQHVLRAVTQETAQSMVYAILIGWIVQQDLAQEIHECMNQVQQVLEKEDADELIEEERKEGENVESEWRLNQLTSYQICQEIAGSWDRKRLEKCGESLQRYVGERGRKRVYRWFETSHWIINKDQYRQEETTPTKRKKRVSSPASSASGTRLE